MPPFAPTGFSVFVHPDLPPHSYADEQHHLDNQDRWAEEPVGVWSVYDGPRLSGQAAHTPWLLVVVDGRFRAINAAFTRPYLTPEDLGQPERETKQADAPRPRQKRVLDALTADGSKDEV